MPTGKGFIRRFTQSPKAIVRKSCVIALVRWDASADETTHRPLNSKERKAFALLSAVWLGVEDGCDLWRVSLANGLTVDDVRRAMKQNSLPSTCGPFYGIGEVLGSAGSGPEKKGVSGKLHKQAVKNCLESGSEMQLLFQLFGSGTVDLDSVTVPTIHDAWGEPMGGLLSPFIPTLADWRKFNKRFPWFGAVFTVLHSPEFKGSLPYSEWKGKRAVLENWILYHRKGLPTFAGGTSKASKEQTPNPALHAAAMAIIALDERMALLGDYVI